MAAGTISKMRLIKSTDNKQTFNDCHTVQHLRALGYNDINMIVFEYEAAFANGYTETSAPNAVFDGTSTPVEVYVISSSDTDKDAADGAARKVTVIGINNSDEFATEEISITAAGGTTQAAGTTLWKRIFHAYVSDWGSGGDDAEGNITITDDGQSATYLTIAAGKNDSDGGAFWVPQYYNVAVAGIQFVLVTSANANAALLFKVNYNDFDGEGVDPDFQNEQYRITINGQGGLRISESSCWHYADGLSKVTPYDSYKGAAETGNVKVAYVTYKTTTKGAQRSIG